MSTRSVLLGTFKSTGVKNPDTIYECPQGFTTIVKSIYADVQYAGPIEGELAIIDDRYTMPCRLLVINATAQEQVHWEGWAVFEYPQRIQAYASAAGLVFWVSGAVLPD